MLQVIHIYSAKDIAFKTNSIVNKNFKSNQNTKLKQLVHTPSRPSNPTSISRLLSPA